jgi:hypothetical protein
MDFASFAIPAFSKEKDYQNFASAWKVASLRLLVVGFWLLGNADGRGDSASGESSGEVGRLAASPRTSPFPGKRRLRSHMESG